MKHFEFKDNSIPTSVNNTKGFGESQIVSQVTSEQSSVIYHSRVLSHFLDQIVPFINIQTRGKSYVSSHVEVCMVGQVDDGCFSCGGTVVKDEFIVRGELVGHNSGQFSWVTLLTVCTHILQQQLLTLDRTLPNPLRKQGETKKILYMYQYNQIPLAYHQSYLPYIKEMQFTNVAMPFRITKKKILI